MRCEPMKPAPPVMRAFIAREGYWGRAYWDLDSRASR